MAEYFTTYLTVSAETAVVTLLNLFALFALDSSKFGFFYYQFLHGRWHVCLAKISIMLLLCAGWIIAANNVAVKAQQHGGFFSTRFGASGAPPPSARSAALF